MNFSVQPGYVQGVHLSALGFDGVVDGAKAQLLGADVFGVAADGVFDDFAGEAELADGGDSAKGYVDMRMARVEVGYGDPLQFGAEFLREASH